MHFTNWWIFVKLLWNNLLYKTVNFPSCLIESNLSVYHGQKIILLQKCCYITENRSVSQDQKSCCIEVCRYFNFTSIVLHQGSSYRFYNLLLKRWWGKMVTRNRVTNHCLKQFAITQIACTLSRYMDMLTTLTEFLIDALSPSCMIFSCNNFHFIAALAERCVLGPF